MIKDRIWTLVSRKLSGEATASELSEMEELLKSPGNNDLYLRAIDEYWSTPTEKDEEFLEATYHLHLNRLKEKGFELEAEKDKDEDQVLFLATLVNAPRQNTGKKVFIGATILAVFAVIFFWVKGFEANPVLANKAKTGERIVSTKSGTRTQIQLPDGSKIWLNGNSRIWYDNKTFGGKDRQVTLSGEAYFDIVKNVDKPFTIHTNKMEIRVLGTAFNVKAYPGDKNSETSLIRGSIEVTLKEGREKFMMKPNDKLVLNDQPGQMGGINKNNKIVANPQQDPSVSMEHLNFAHDKTTIMETAWVENKLVFDNESFEEIALKMERWYGVEIHFNEEDLKSQRMTGAFEGETLTTALEALKMLSPFNYHIKNDSITIAK